MIEITKEQLIIMIHEATGNIKDFVTDQDNWIDEAIARVKKRTMKSDVELYMENLGCTIIDYDYTHETLIQDFVYQYVDNYSLQGDAEVFSIDASTLEDMVSNNEFLYEIKKESESIIYSCCGEELDKDVMICGICKEHC